jgi:hypothetical protein
MFLELVVWPVACRGCGKVKRGAARLSGGQSALHHREIRMQLRAVEQLAKLCGFNEPEKMEMEHGTRRQELVEVIARLRGR